VSQEVVSVLLLGECAKGASRLSWHLEQRGCHCWFASAAEQGIALFKKFRFPLILSTNPIRQTARMISLLGRSNCSVFYAYTVENGCWWLPLMKGGKKCLGATALRPREFVGVLDQTLKEIRANYLFVVPKQLQEVAYDNARALKVAS
jgi:hypothetical protein